jgi:hypothetical protein
MIFFPALAAVQMWYVNDWRAQVKREGKNSTKSVMPRQETNFECYRLDETCQRIHLFTADGDDTLSCQEVLEHGPLCL